MAKKLTQEEVIKQFRKVHGYEYDYSKVEYKGIEKRVKIICKKHGLFSIRVDKHRQGQKCPICTKLKNTKRKRIPKKNESLGDKRPDLIKYFINKEDAFKYFLQSSKEGELRCPICGYKKIVMISSLSNQGFYCNNCNSFEVNYPELMVYLKNKNDGKLSKGSNKKIQCICPDCGAIKTMKICLLTSYGFSCSVCSDGISIPEKFVANLLRESDIEFKTEYKPLWSNNKRYDFYLPNYNMIIEAHGSQHYEQSLRYLTLQEEQENDRLKKELALKNGIKHYIVIDCRKSKLNWLKENCIKELSLYFDLTDINWIKVWENCQKSLVKEVCKTWKNKDENETVDLISNKFNVHRNTTIKYLKRGNELGWCNYNGREETVKSHRKKVCQHTKDNIFVKEYISVRGAEAMTKIPHTNISACCRGKIKSAGGYIWRYADEK